MKSSNPKTKKTTTTDFVFGRKNYIIMAIGIATILLGFILMSGGGSDDSAIFNPEIYNFRRIRLAPFLVLLGFVIQVIAILSNPKTTKK